MELFAIAGFIMWVSHSGVTVWTSSHRYCFSCSFRWILVIMRVQYILLCQQRLLLTRSVTVFLTPLPLYPPHPLLLPRPTSPCLSPPFLTSVQNKCLSVAYFQCSVLRVKRRAFIQFSTFGEWSKGVHGFRDSASTTTVCVKAFRRNCELWEKKPSDSNGASPAWQGRCQCRRLWQKKQDHSAKKLELGQVLPQHDTL